MNDPLKNLSFPVVLFILALTLVFGFIYIVDRADASTLFLDTGTGASDLGFNVWGGNTRVDSSSLQHARTISDIGLRLGNPALGTSTGWTLNIGYGTTPTSSRDASNAISWVATTTGLLTDLTTSTSPAWYTINLGDGVYIPYGQNMYVRFYSGSSAFNTEIGRGSSGSPPNYAGGVCINTMCDSSLGVDMRLYEEGGFSGTENIEFRFPEAGIVTPDFYNWTVALSNMATSSLYYIKINAYLTTSTVSSSENGTEYNSFSTFTGAVSSPYFSFPKNGNLTPNIGDGVRYWLLTAYLCADQYCFVPLDTHSITISTDFDAEIPDTPYSSYSGPFHNADDFLYTLSGEKLTREYVDAWQNEVWCISPTSTSWWGDFLSADHLFYGLCRVNESLWRPSDGDWSKFAALPYTMLRETMPFSMFWNAVEVVRDQFTDTISDEQSTLTLDLTDALPGSSEVVLLSSSTFSGFIGATTTDQIMTVERYVVWLTFVGIIASTILL